MGLIEEIKKRPTNENIVFKRQDITKVVHDGTTIWAKVFDISYNLNGGNISNNKTSYTQDDDDYSLPAPSKTGYTLVGWTGSNGSNAETDVVIPKGSIGNKNYTANWTPTIYDIDVDLKGGTSAQNPKTYNITSGNITLNRPTRGGSTFKGWTGSNGSSPQLNVTIPAGSIGNKHYVANYNVTTYSITYNLNGGTLSSANPTTYTANDIITLKKPTKVGYKFAGWIGTELSAATEDVSWEYKWGNRSYEAKWTPIEYTITYDLNDGKIEKQKHKYTIEDEFVLPTPVKEQCNFDGWTGSNGETAEIEVTIKKGTTGDKSYTANWVKGGEVYIVKRISDLSTTALAKAMKSYLDNVGEIDNISGNSMADHGATTQVQQETTSNFKWTSNINSSIGSMTFDSTGKNINFKGNNRNAGSNAIWYIPTQGSEQAFSFTYNLDFGDSFNSAGFLLRVKDIGSSISGYALNLNKNGSAQLSKFSRPKNTTANISWQTVQSLNITKSGSLKVTATNTYVEIEGGGLSKTRINLDTNYVLNNCGAGYGFYSDHYRHSCSNIGNFDIKNFNLITTTVLTMKDVIGTGTGTGSASSNKQIFERDDSIHFLINVDTTVDPGLQDADLIKRLKAEHTHIIFIGNNTNKTAAETFINAVGAGTFIQTTGDVNKDANNAAEYMHKTLKEAAGNT